MRLHCHKLAPQFMRGITQILITSTASSRPRYSEFLASATPGRGIANFLLPVTENLHTLGNIAGAWYQRWSKGLWLGVAFFSCVPLEPPSWSEARTRACRPAGMLIRGASWTDTTTEIKLCSSAISVRGFCVCVPVSYTHLTLPTKRIV